MPRMNDLGGEGGGYPAAVAASASTTTTTITNRVNFLGVLRSEGTV